MLSLIFSLRSEPTRDLESRAPSILKYPIQSNPIQSNPISHLHEKQQQPLTTVSLTPPRDRARDRDAFRLFFSLSAPPHP